MLTISFMGIEISYFFFPKFEKAVIFSGRWYDMVWMEKIIGEHRPDQPDIVPYQY